MIAYVSIGYYLPATTQAFSSLCSCEIWDSSFEGHKIKGAGRGEAELTEFLCAIKYIGDVMNTEKLSCEKSSENLVTIAFTVLFLQELDY